MEPNISALIVAIKSIETHISDRANSLIIRMPLPALLSARGFGLSGVWSAVLSSQMGRPA